MGAIPIADDVLDANVELIGLREAAQRLDVSESKVRQLLRERKLLAVKREGDVLVPAEFFAEDGPVKGLAGTLTVLADAGFEPTEMLTWLFSADESLPGTTPINALRTNHGGEVKRRAQALAF